VGAFSNQSGFTLVEMLVVIAILGILAAVAIPNLVGMQNKGTDQAAATEFNIVQKAVNIYMAENNGAVPADIDALSVYFTSPLHGTYTWDTAGKVTQTAYP